MHRVGERSWLEPRRALVTGAGPIGLLAALLGVQQGPGSDADTFRFTAVRDLRLLMATVSVCEP